MADKIYQILGNLPPFETAACIRCRKLFEQKRGSWTLYCTRCEKIEEKHFNELPKARRIEEFSFAKKQEEALKRHYFKTRNKKCRPSPASIFYNRPKKGDLRFRLSLVQFLDLVKKWEEENEKQF